MPAPAYGAGVSVRCTAWAPRVSRRQIRRYLEPHRETLDRDRCAARPAQDEALNDG